MGNIAHPYVKREEILAALEIIRRLMPVTPAISWPLLNAIVGCELWVKHENHTPIGSFKIRGGLVYMHHLNRESPSVTGVVTGTRGNHGQSVALAARRVGLSSTIVVPSGNSRGKNAATRGFGAEVIERGSDFQDALQHAYELASERQLHFVPAFDRELVVGVATCAWEFFGQQPEIDRLYVPIGLGSGVCAAIAVRDALGLKTSVIGVVADNAPTYALSVAEGRPVAAAVRPTIADGVACREAHPEALSVIRQGIDRIVRVSEHEVVGAMRDYFRCTHNIAEGAGALSLAAAIKDHPHKNERIGIILSGGNVDWDVYSAALGASDDG